jgi:hypothetical protein
MHALAWLVAALALPLSSSFRPAWSVSTALRTHRIHKKHASSQPATEADDIRFVVSTGCSAYQRWQVEVLKASFLRVKQKGKLTHIVVGCDSADQSSEIRTSSGGSADVTITHKQWATSSMTEGVEIFYVPAAKMAKKFPWFNKPWAFYQWAANTTIKETTVVIMDPDQVFLSAIDNSLSYSADDLLSLTDKKHLEKLVLDMAHPARVSPGVAVAQTYGLGDGWIRPKMFDRPKICGAESYCSKVTSDDAWAYYSVGPPYFLHKDDFTKVCTKWWDFMPEVYAQDEGDIQADMYAYNMAAADLGIKHATYSRYMVANEESDSLEAWKWVDAYGHISCVDFELPDGRQNPAMLHAAGHYRACTGGEKITSNDDEAKCTLEGSEMWEWHKGHVPTQIMDCGQRLLLPPPDDFIDIQKTQYAKRRAFMICAFTKVINDGMLAYKQASCPPGFSTKKCIRILRNPTTDIRVNPDGYNRARVSIETPGCSL